MNLRAITNYFYPYRILDIGANVGSWALSNYTPTTKIVCVEASPTTFLDLQKNFSIHSNIIDKHYEFISLIYFYFI
jgi:tRNA1(Val) A37 N6-methylase TrmN6